MSDFVPYEPFSVCFNVLKIKYFDYDELLVSKNFLNPNDKVNVFINLESVFKHLSMINDLEKKILAQRDFEILMISNIINLAAHYRKFFVNNGLDTNVYIYNTDFKSDEFGQYKYNEDYRTYYLVKFNDNPKFALLTDKLKDEILPRIKTICDFIPSVYYISAHNVEGSLVPYIIGNNDKSRKNIILGNEIFDTQYNAIPNFLNHYICRTFNNNYILSDIKSSVSKLTKKENDSTIFTNYNTYCALMAIIGNKLRSIDSIYGLGVKTFEKLFKEGIVNNVINENTCNPEMISEIFDDKMIKEDFINNYYCSSIISSYNELHESDKDSIINQKFDKADINSLLKLNTSIFYNHPLILDGLL